MASDLEMTANDFICKDGNWELSDPRYCLVLVGLELCRWYDLLREEWEELSNYLPGCGLDVGTYEVGIRYYPDTNIPRPLEDTGVKPYVYASPTLLIFKNGKYVYPSIVGYDAILELVKKYRKVYNLPEKTYITPPVVIGVSKDG